ncbi:MAG: DNA primase [Ruminococcaceae bacterium]|nr:DNA primase [Oscillospiraceae bacterium]
MLIPREIIDDIRARNDIVDVIGMYVNLKRAGSNYNGLCPYHSEKTPSFTVFPGTQSFYCFGCGAGGDVITFTMKSENLDYVGAIEFLAKKSGISIPQSAAEQQGGMSRNRVFQMNLEAAKYFRSCLFDEKLGSDGLRYLVEQRRLPMTIIKRFGLGFAPDSFWSLTNHMTRLGFTEDELIAGFLGGKSKKSGKIYDYFRNRVIFPIIDTSGNVIAFGGRVMDDSKPKYLNSSDTPGFKKSKNLFALNYAKNHCSERLILCEGYMDVIALHAAGIENAVATLGTALTQEQARMMAKYTKQVIISYDSDEAGQRAAARAISMLSDVGLDVKILKMKEAKDPDEYIKKFGVENFKRLIGESRTGFEYKIENVIAKYDITLSENKIKAAGELCDYISGVSSSVERDVYTSSVASRLSLSFDSLKNDVERLRRKKLNEYKAKTFNNMKMSAMGIGDRTNPDAAKNIRAAAAEEAIIGLLLIFDEYRDAIMNEKISLSSDDFLSDFHRRVFEKIMQLHADDGGFSFSLLGEYFVPDEMGRIQGIEQKRRALTQNGYDVLYQCVQSLKNEKNSTDSDDGISEIERLLENKRKKMQNQ